ncbi:hypothetical protein C8J56DRAFT_1027664, partial [Mycena floridula]
MRRKHLFPLLPRASDEDASQRRLGCHGCRWTFNTDDLPGASMDIGDHLVPQS